MSDDEFEEMEFHGYTNLKRIKLNVPPWPGSSVKPVSSNFLVDEVSDTISEYSSDVTKLANSPPLDNMVLDTMTSARTKPTRVFSFAELVTTPIKREEKPVEIAVEPMKCDEVTKCETKRKKRDEVTKCETKCKKRDEVTKSETKRKKRDVSLVERFTEEEIMSHIMSLKKGSSNQTVIEETCEVVVKKEDSCQLCGEEKIMLPAPPLYCSHCGKRIKDESFYYIYIPEEATSDEQQQQQQHRICNSCHTKARSNFMLCGITITKANMVKKSNLDNQVAEAWVLCETCNKWQHSICGLYNQDKDRDKTADYICPHCLLDERQSINYTRSNDNTDLEAKDLPETILSHFIEQRLSRRLREERYQTAKATGKSIDDVSAPEDLTVRVVFSADRILNVNKQFVDLLQKEHYPSEFPYRSKVILLFQKVEGVDVCIFALFVQEFGSECSSPNQRSIYIVYLDSVKYFRPERATFSGEALRTFVYHEILIGYLEHCKNRGFTAAYIWACPPKKGQDYIMYSHPKTQKNPSTNKLRHWYKSMTKKAKEQRVVTEVTYLYNRFFFGEKESISAAKLPYFEGSFWSIQAEHLVQNYEKEGDNKVQKKVNSLSKRQLKGLNYKTTDDAKKIILVQELEKTIHKSKEDVMVLVLNHSCTRCSKPILSGLRWFCNTCKNLNLCEKCYDEKQELPGGHMHTTNGKEKHFFSQTPVNGIQSTTEDNDVILENEIFENRMAFLNFSQKHNYSFDMLRRAKHSTMMILHHLHTSNKQHHQNSTSLLQVTCKVCNKDVSATIYYSCFVCSDYRLCTGCYCQQKDLRQFHLFPLLPSAHGTTPRTLGVLEILKALLHAQACPHKTKNSCSYPKCYEVKTLFYHSRECKSEDKRACIFCVNLWKIIKIHAYHCQDPNCSVPRCRDVKDHFTRTISGASSLWCQRYEGNTSLGVV